MHPAPGCARTELPAPAAAETSGPSPSAGDAAAGLSSPPEYDGGKMHGQCSGTNEGVGSNGFTFKKYVRLMQLSYLEAFQTLS